ncbi:MAG TPA: hypothetical protein VH352_19640, partial [Pseudonocardiaceae bacterium]|nr:hypothetical protein [Pseudonocardiaceae bacterium]
SVTVEVAIGGGLRSVRLTGSALDLGASRLARTVLQVAARATALANQRANLTFRRTLGRSTDELLDGLGLSFPPELVADDDSGEQGVLRR